MRIKFKHDAILVMLFGHITIAEMCAFALRMMQPTVNAQGCRQVVLCAIQVWSQAGAPLIELAMFQVLV